MTKLSESKLIRDLKSIPSPIFYVFATVVLCCSIFICGFTVRGILTGIFLVLLTACASSDIKDGIVADFVHILIVVLSFLNIMSRPNIAFDSILEHLIGAVIVSVPMLIIALIIKGAFGGGDIKLMASSGLYLGAKAIIAGFTLGMFSAGLYAIVLLILHKVERKSKIRLVPFLVYGLVIISLYVEQNINRLSIVAQMC